MIKMDELIGLLEEITRSGKGSLQGREYYRSIKNDLDYNNSMILSSLYNVYVEIYKQGGWRADKELFQYRDDLIKQLLNNDIIIK